MTGTIIRTTDNGYFFIKGIEDGRQYFGHKKSLRVARWIHEIREGDHCSFEPHEAEQGPRALDIFVTRLGQ